jgi:YidC/Oxa1 family membrane protein insertase
MQTKRTIIAMVVMMALVLIWPWTINRIGTMLGYDMTYQPPAATQPATAPAQGNVSPSTSSTASIASGTSSMNAATTQSNGLRVASTAQPTKTELGSPALKDPMYPLAVRVVSEGAAIDGVILNDYKRSVGGDDPYIYQEPYKGFENLSRPLATRSIIVGGTTLDLTNAQWTLQESSPKSATFTLDIAGPLGPLVRAIKKFEVYDRADKANGAGYEVQVTYTTTNLTDKPIDVAFTFNGPTTPPRELDRGSDRMVVGGYFADPDVYVSQHYVESFGKKQSTLDYTKADKNNYPLMWAGTASIYFNAIVRPVTNDPNVPTATTIEKVEAVSLNPEVEDSKEHAVTLAFTTKSSQIAPRGELTLANRAFFGPKLRKLLKDDYYGTLPRHYDATLIITSGMCGFCTFPWLINTLVALLNVLHVVLLKDWGLAIIALVFIVRFALHPITKKSQENMARMSKFGPELDKIKKKYADDSDAMNKEMMKFYKEHGATPILGCLPMFLQMPIWIALWSALQSTFELRHAGFLRWENVHLTWIRDLSQPDHLITLAHPVTLFGLIPISGLNILPIFLGIVFFIQQKYFTPKPPTMSAEQEQQQKMMGWMSLLFPVMLYPGPSGLNLYIFASTTFGIIESKRIRDHIKQREAAEAEGKVIVDAGKKLGGGGGSKSPGKQPTKAPGRLGGLLATLQQKAEEMQRDQQRRKPR